MYLSYYNLKEKPFLTSSDSKFLWLGEKHKEALATLKYGIMNDKGFLLLTGDIGTGKTTLVNALINSLGEDIIVAKYSYPILEKLDFFNFIGNIFNMNGKFASKGEFLFHLKNFLHDSHQKNKKVLLIIDEVQKLSQELLQEIRLLSNIEKQNEKLLNIFLVGQNEFKEIILRDENRALRQRITLNYTIEPLTSKETAAYISHRLSVAGSKNNIFNNRAIRKIFSFSGGYPRLINIICDYALLTGYVKETQTIDADIILECAAELKLTEQKKETEKPKQKVKKTTPVTTTAPQKNRKKGIGKKALKIGVLSILLIAIGYFYNHNSKSFNKLNDSASPVAEQTKKDSNEADSVQLREEPKLNKKSTSDLGLPVVKQDIADVSLDHHTHHTTETTNIPVTPARTNTKLPEPASAKTPPQNFIPIETVKSLEKKEFTRHQRQKRSLDRKNLLSALRTMKSVSGEKIQSEEKETQTINSKSAESKVISPIKTKFVPTPPQDISLDKNPNNTRSKISLSSPKASKEDLESKPDTAFNQKEPSKDMNEYKQAKEVVKPEKEPQPAEMKIVSDQPKDKLPENNSIKIDKINTDPDSTHNASEKIISKKYSHQKIKRISEKSSKGNNVTVLKTNNPKAIEWDQKSYENVIKGKFAEAVEAASKAVELDPGLVNPYINRAWAYCETGWFDKAIQDCNTVLRIDPNNALAYNNRGLAYQRKNEAEKAECNYKKACSIGFKIACNNYEQINKINTVNRLLDESRHSFQNGNWDKAIETASMILKIDPKNEVAYINRSAAYAQKGLLERAYDDSNKAIKLNPGFGLAYNNRAYALELLGKIEKAAADYEKSCNLGLKLGCQNYHRLNFNQ
ncbi:MAG: AAA family ATPase [Desulfobacterales bacterium]|nr:AAA family ATPase [Desulfobacterales bacterium]